VGVLSEAWIPPAEPIIHMDPWGKGSENEADLALALARQHTGQMEFAYRLAAAEFDRLLYVPGIGWHVWDGCRWREDPDEQEAVRAVNKVIRVEWGKALGDKDRAKQITRLQSANAVVGILALARRLPQLATTVDHLDADPYLLNTPAGTLDLRDLKVRGHDPADRITKVTHGSYRPEADADTAWTGFLERVLPDEDVRDYLARWSGLSLLGTVLVHVLLLLTGTGANGKGTFYKALLHALGDYAAPPAPGLLDQRTHQQHPTELFDLRGRRLMVLSETDKGTRMNEERMKYLTGGDTVKARRMGQDFIAFDPSWTLALVTNHPPKVSADDPAVWRRLRKVDFGVTIPEAEQDGHLDDKLREAADAVLTWAVEGWRDFLDRGERLDEPEPVTAATAAYQVANDAVGRFLTECCYLSPDARVRVSDLMSRWRRWSSAEGVDITDTAFGTELDRRGYGRDKGRRNRHGLGLLADEEASE